MGTVETCCGTGWCSGGDCAGSGAKGDRCILNSGRLDETNEKRMSVAGSDNPREDARGKISTRTSWTK